MIEEQPNLWVKGVNIFKHIAMDWKVRLTNWRLYPVRNLSLQSFSLFCSATWSPWWKHIQLHCLWWWGPMRPPSLSPPPPWSLLWRERRWSLPVRSAPPVASACPLYESWGCRTGSKGRKWTKTLNCFNFCL